VVIIITGMKWDVAIVANVRFLSSGGGANPSCSHLESFHLPICKYLRFNASLFTNLLH
jgi:hypothetical protein